MSHFIRSAQARLAALQSVAKRLSHYLKGTFDSGLRFYNDAIHSEPMRELLTFTLLILTGVTGMAFGFGPMNTFLSVADDFRGFWGSVLQCLVIIPSCGFQTILWWTAYYQPAAEALKGFYRRSSLNIHEENFKSRAFNYLKWLRDDEISILFDKDSGTTNPDPDYRRRWLADSYVQSFLNTLSTQSTQELVACSNACKNQNLADASTQVQHLIQLELLLHHLKQQPLAPEAQTEVRLSSRLLHIGRWLVPRVANFLNYMTINPFGVFFAFYTALLTLSFPGVRLATLVLPSVFMPVMYGLLATGYAAGFVCAFFLTRQSFKNVVHDLVDRIEDTLNAHTSGGAHKETQQSLIHTAKTLLKRATLQFQKDVINQRSDSTWSWLTTRPLLGILLAVGCAISVCILNYYSGIQAAILLGDMAVLLTPGALTSAHNLMNASIAQKAFGAYSALVSVGMTSALLLSVSTAAKPQHMVESTRKNPNEKGFYWAAILFSALGQLFCNYVNTFKPHGILSALRLVKAPCERLFQSLFGLFSLGGTVIITKLQAESADDLLEMAKPYQDIQPKSQNSKSVRKQDAHNSWFSMDFLSSVMGKKPPHTKST